MMKRGVADTKNEMARKTAQSLFMFLMVWVNSQMLFAQTIRFTDTYLSLQQAVHKASTARDIESINPAAPLYNVVALRVEFQPDTTRFTTGNGTFGAPLFDSLRATVDPLPHDAAYFEAHLQFLSNYIEKASDGQTQVMTHLIPEVIQLSGQMGAYSPTGLEADSDTELRKLSGMVEEAWQLANVQATLDVSQFDPATTAFVIFHAGIGRDIELVGTTLDKTPEDIPTIFFNDESLDRLNGGRSVFKGLSVDHTIIMPRTETRQGFDFIQDQPFLVEFSINGLLAASFFNYLGVPDLFNTETGESAIGPFGLMDPLGLFAFNGLFPPEPSGWTKKFLGWEQPILVDGQAMVGIEVLAASGNADTELYQIPISEAEYFLVENRFRDLDQNGLVLTIYRDGAFFEQRIQNGQEDFNSLNIEAFEGGVVVDVDDYDWALPGGVDEDDNQLLGGLLIWHIDERVLANELPTNSVNADPVHRAIDLEEADSAQDLGFPSGNIFGPQAHLGTPFDFFYEGNPVVVITSSGEEISLYQNRFAADTQPNSNANSGGASFITLSGFTLPGPSMFFDYTREQGGSVRLIDTFPGVTRGNVPDGTYVTALNNPNDGILFIDTNQGLVSSAESASEATLLVEGPTGLPVVLPDNTIALLEQGENQSLFLQVLGSNNPLRLDLGITVDQDFNIREDSKLLYEPIEGRYLVLIRSEAHQRTVFEVTADAGFSEVRSDELGGTPILYSMALTDESVLAILTDTGVQLLSTEMGWNFRLEDGEEPGQLVLGRDNTGLVAAFVEKTTGDIFQLQANSVVRRTNIRRFATENFMEGSAQDPVLVDLDADGTLDILTIVGNTVFAVTTGGGLVDGFPYVLPAKAATQPFLTTITGSNTWAIIAGAEDGQIYSIDLAAQGRELQGFPLSVGLSLSATPFLEDNTLFAVSPSGDVRAWELDQVSNVWWGMNGGNRFNSNFVSISRDEPINTAERLLIGGEVYNWPNPIRDGQTFFRLTTSADAEIRITIVDAAGALIDVLDIGVIRANAASDVEWQADVESGLYYARVEAEDTSGNSETVLIKMAVIR